MAWGNCKSELEDYSGQPGLQERQGNLQSWLCSMPVYSSVPTKAGFEFGPCLKSVQDEQNESSWDVSVPADDKRNPNSWPGPASSFHSGHSLVTQILTFARGSDELFPAAQPHTGTPAAGSGCTGFVVPSTLGSQSWATKSTHLGIPGEVLHTGRSVISHLLVLYSSCCSLEQGHQECFSLLSQNFKEPQLPSGAGTARNHCLENYRC